MFHMCCCCVLHMPLTVVHRSYTPFDDEVSFKPIAGVNRYIAIEGGSFFEAVVRGEFSPSFPLATIAKDNSYYYMYISRSIVVPAISIRACKPVTQSVARA